jgi:hypothetical protein
VALFGVNVYVLQVDLTLWRSVTDVLRRHAGGRFETFVMSVPEISGEGTSCEVETCLDLLLSMKEGREGRKKERKKERRKER